MPKPKKNAPSINLNDPQYYINRELSWLEFNNRVLYEACDPRTPLLERLKFLAIFSSNLDEFFMVRVAGLKQQVEATVNLLTTDGRTPQKQLDDIRLHLHPQLKKQNTEFQEVLQPLLRQQGICILDYIELNQQQRNYLDNYFQEQIFPVLTPLAVDPSHPFPHISNLSLNLAVVVKNPDTEEEFFARVKVPQVLPRFLPLPPELRTEDNGKTANWSGIPLEQAIAHNLESLFPGMSIQEYHPFRITRDADLELEEDEAEDLLLAIEQELRKRRMGGTPVRLEIRSQTPESIRSRLLQDLGLTENDIYEVDGLLGLRDLMYFLLLPLPDLKDPPRQSVVPSRLQRLKESCINPDVPEPEDGKDFFSVIREKDLLVHHPYQSFSGTVVRFITSAAHDPNVLAMKMTLYRTSGDSPIVNALIAAAENGKQVSVLVELKARFDEENNIYWARRLERVGVHVVYGLVGLKTHSKIVLVVRREKDKMRRYVHIGTGNYNPKTARLYTDLGLFSCREELGADLTDVFNFLTGYSRQKSYREIIVAPVNMRDRFLELIKREIENVQNGFSGRIVAKMNALVDPQIISALYEASRAGVQIDLIIRGICCLRPGLLNLSHNIRVISIIGRFLEHSRIYYFYNNNQEEIYIGSADWMRRNLDRRVEVITPIKDQEIAKDLQEILGIMLADNRHAWELQPDGNYIQRCPGDNCPEANSQKTILSMALRTAGIN
ncbi:polyphosphate kinase 1 [Aphanizomenon flos-aquae NRERC-008]|uniref:Polyphosphate kinase n=2 Tax=Aphanizomenon flos-aquae TaxID=1176 RepID=A0ABR8IN09_APHFL|nr:MULTISPECIES: polyphosphate kinase 1 [Aphanizomenon]MCE2906933.1 polyphosphate kinase 1 [Anabaena sp. CoA2_C59]MDJ0507373.1 polyphosphate kinase 1 [Nostocales cyanobacterium LE14-WE12]OBQ27537.1 MAG: polyphosphate kinase [Aphanizomenon flos-aquae MDT14a]MBD2388924.1 polyphosphate kinase 1 [Aphanizomenon flos-aquae FACHB-1171]MBD2555548.1 polyphosphate kinase 1 [Aphanizomenon flos-aquae FACHB-1290]